MAPKSILAAALCVARPAALAMAADGALLVSDDTNGMIYRISHEAGEG